MAPVTFVRLSDVTAPIMPAPLSALCVFQISQLEKCKGGSNNEHTAPETSWGPAGLSPPPPPRTHKYICPNNALITELTLAVSPWTSNITRPTTTPPPPLFLLPPCPILLPPFSPRSVFTTRGDKGPFFMLPAVHELDTLEVHEPRTCLEKGISLDCACFMHELKGLGWVSNLLVQHSSAYCWMQRRR